MVSHTSVTKDLEVGKRYVFFCRRKGTEYTYRGVYRGEVFSDRLNCKVLHIEPQQPGLVGVHVAHELVYDTEEIA